jgi:hypothetical protein
MKTKCTLVLSIVMCWCIGLQAQILPGTSCFDAVSIVCDGTIYSGSTVGVMNDNVSSGATTCSTSVGTSGQAWYTWTANNSSMVDMTTCYPTTGFDTKLHVFTGDCGALSCVVGNDDACGSMSSSVTFTAIEGLTYFIRVGGFASQAGDYSFSATCYALGDYGCTDSLAINYDPAATINDGSCQYTVYGCTDPTAINFNQGANTDDGSCAYCNAEGSVNATLYLCTFSNANQVALDILDQDGNVVISLDGGTLSSISYHDLCLNSGECYTAVMSNSAGLNGWYNGYFWVNGTGGQYINTGLENYLSTQSVIFSVDGTCTTIYGCTDSTAVNYNANANTDDGSCIMPVNCDGLNTVTAVMTTGSFASETWFEILDADGNVVFVGNNYTANQMTYSATMCLADGCYTLVTHDTFGDGWNGGTLMLMANGTVTSYGLPSGYFGYGTFALNAEGCEPAIALGCINPSASNFDPTALYDDGSCIFTGCTDPSAINFNPTANEDDGSCEYCAGEGSVIAQLYVCTFSNGQQVELEILDDQGNVVSEVSGLSNGQIFYTTICLQPGMCYTANMINNEGPFGWSNGYFWINGTGGQYINAQPGATDAFASQVFSIDGTCGAVVVYGCTDPVANNYNAEATNDDGSCIYGIDCDMNTVTVTIVSQMWGTEMGWNITNENGEVVFEGDGLNSWSMGQTYLCLPNGCYQFNMTDSWGDGWNGGYYMIDLGGAYYEGSLYYGSAASNDFSINGACTEISGCTNEFAMNYNPQATFDDGSCMFNNNDGFLAGGFIGLEMGVNLYPNPANSGLVVNVSNLDRTADVAVSIIAMDGRLVTRQQVANAEGSKLIEMNVETLAPGFYVVQVENGANRVSTPLIKE